MMKMVKATIEEFAEKIDWGAALGSSLLHMRERASEVVFSNICTFEFGGRMVVVQLVVNGDPEAVAAAMRDMNEEVH